jgi:hypothetical protein
MSKGNIVGIIAEDVSDISSIIVFIKRIINKQIGSKSFSSKGCGKLKRKCSVWAEQLKLRGCNALIIVHDLDENNLHELYNYLQESISPCPFKKYFICIPVKELEAWFLSDPEAIQKTFGLQKKPNIKGLPETINSPKEYLEDLVYRYSDKRSYINTTHNAKISEHTSLDLLKKKCPSFVRFYDFVANNL